MTAKKPADGAALEVATFDLDAWIDATERPEVTVSLYPLDVEHLAKVAAIEAQIPGAEKAGEDRGIDEPSAAGLLAQIAELRAERDASALKVRVRQMTEAELFEVTKAAVADGVKDAESLGLLRIASACVEPVFTSDQLRRLRARDRSGEAMVNQLADAFNSLSERGIPVPS